jgi:hypothetical protein
MKKQRVSVANGWVVCNYPTIGKTFKGELAKLPAAVYKACLCADHGIKQKLGDAKSGESAGEKYAEVQLIWAALMQGEWERTATYDRTPLIVEAVARIKNFKFSSADGKVFLTAKKPDGKNVTFTPSEAQVTEWAGDQKVKAMIAAMNAERAKKLADEATDEITVELPE